MPFELLSLNFVAIVLVVCIAAFVQSLSGFGFALVAMPVLVLFIEPESVVPFSLILGSLLNVFALSDGLRSLASQINWQLIAGCILGISINILLLNEFLNALTLRLLVGMTGLVFGVVVLLGRFRRLVASRPLSIVVGVVSGVLNSSTSMGGGPVALYLMYQGVDKSRLRIELLSYILIVNVITLAAWTIDGTFNVAVLGFTAAMIPVMLIGFGFGKLLYNRLSQRRFTNVVAGVVVVTSLMGGLSAIANYVGVTHCFGVFC